MKEQKDKNSNKINIFSIALASGAMLLITGCVAAIPVHPVHHYPATTHTSHVIHTPRPAVYRAPAVVPVVRPVAPVARAASPVGVHGTARRTSRRVTRRH